MTNVKDLMDLIKAATTSSTGVVNITINVGADTPLVDEGVETPTLPDTDFDIGDRVLVCHQRKDGTPVHTYGIVDTVLGYDDNGYYTRVTGDNGKHYRTGIVYNQERLGSKIVIVEG